MPAQRATLVIACALMMRLVDAADAQSLWIPRDRDRSITIAAVRPSLEVVDENFSPVVTLTARLPLGARIGCVAELSYAHLATGEDFMVPVSGVPGTAFGNPYLGLEWHPSESPLFAELGVRAPVMGDGEPGAGFLGQRSNVMFLEAFQPKMVSIQTAINLREVTASHMAYRLRLSPTVAIPTQRTLPYSFLPRETELFAIYSWQIGYEGALARVGGALSGRALLTEDNGNLGQRTQNQIEFHADFGSGAIRPGFDLRLPLGLFDAGAVPLVWGVNLSWSR